MSRVEGRSVKQIIEYCKQKIEEVEKPQQAKLKRVIELAKTDFMIVENTQSNLRQKISTKLIEKQEESKRLHEQAREKERQSKIAKAKKYEQKQEKRKEDKQIITLVDLYKKREEIIVAYKNNKIINLEKELSIIENQIIQIRNDKRSKNNQ